MAMQVDGPTRITGRRMEVVKMDPKKCNLTGDKLERRNKIHVGGPI